MTKGGWPRKQTKTLGITGSAWAGEVTWHPDRGWHLHYHHLLFLHADTDPGQVEDAIRTHVRNAGEVLGLAMNKRTVTVREINRDFGAYFAKCGWDPAIGTPNRWNNGVDTSGRSMTAFELLEVLGNTGDSQAAERFRELVEAMKGAHLTGWSPSARQTFGIRAKDDSKNEAWAAQGQRIGAIWPHELRAIQRSSAGSMLPEVLRYKNMDEIRRFVDDCVHPHVR